MGDLAVVRKMMRAARRSIVGVQRERLSVAAAGHAMRWISALPVRSVAVFMSLPEEIDCQPLTALLWARGYEVYLPVVREKHAPLVWRRYFPDGIFMQDLLHMPVPALEIGCNERNIAPDLTVLPLVAYDAFGHRLGMGGGYYDRSLANSRSRRLGLAYACQAADFISPQVWDVPLEALANEFSLLTFI